ncbi:hypothetical protein LGT39_12185, partial [Demequina sp. TTPB684]
MFFAAVVGPEARLARARSALSIHGSRLAATGWACEPVHEEFVGGTIAWDSSSSHASVFRDPKRGTLLLRAGYLAARDEWDANGRHATENDDAWGEFAAVAIRAPHESRVVLEAFADPAASWPVYYARRGEVAVVSNDPQFVALVLGLTELSEQGVYELLAYHHSLGVETTIAGVKRLFPGDRLRVEATTAGVVETAIEHRRVYAYTRMGTPSEVIERDALDALRRGVAEIRPLSSGRFADATVQLSGGLDSRLTAAVLADVFPERPVVVTLDLSKNDELEVAREVATRLGYPHRVETLSTTDLTTMRQGWFLTGGQVSPYAAAGNILSYETAHRGANGQVLLVGAWPGDCLIGSYIPIVPGMTSRALRHVMVVDWGNKRGRRRAELAGTVTGPAASRVERAARRRLRRRLSEGSGSTAAQMISYWAMFSRQPAFSYIAPAMLTSHVLPVTPVLAKPYVEQLLRLSGNQIVGKNWYRAMISHGFPALEGIRNASTARPVTDEVVKATWKPSSLDDLYMRLPEIVQRAAHATVGRLRRRVTTANDSAEEEHWSTVLAGGERESVTAGG